MLRLILAGVLALGAAACAGAGDERPAPTVMGDETGPPVPAGTQSPGGGDDDY